MTNKEKQAKVDAFVKETAAFLRPMIKEIEKAPAVTQGHYGRYLSILLSFEDTTIRKLVALSLLEAGANPDGVRGACANAW